MEDALLFFGTYLIVFLIYRILILISKIRQTTQNILEVSYLEKKYKLNLEKINMKKLLLVISLISSLDITIIVTVIFMTANGILQIIIALAIVLPITLLSYSLVGKYYVKKGMIKNV